MYVTFSLSVALSPFQKFTFMSYVYIVIIKLHELQLNWPNNDGNPILMSRKSIENFCDKIWGNIARISAS
jgi:hypothetical protein